MPFSQATTSNVINTEGNLVLSGMNEKGAPLGPPFLCALCVRRPNVRD